MSEASILLCLKAISLLEVEGNWHTRVTRQNPYSTANKKRRHTQLFGQFGIRDGSDSNLPTTSLIILIILPRGGLGVERDNSERIK